ncbi:hypothetical protein EON79_21110 [bacterium]|nr:MAG: hypothetical protein EON79_21110 [bacterium]
MANPETLARSFAAPASGTEEATDATFVEEFADPRLEGFFALCTVQRCPKCGREFAPVFGCYGCISKD